MNEYLLLFGIFVAFFHRLIFCGYVVDDDAWTYKMKQTIEGYKKNKKTLKGFMSMIYMSLYGSGIFQNPVKEHIFNGLLHFTNAALMYKATGSFLASVLYMINPVNNQTALWLNGRRYAVCVFCCLLAWNFKEFMIPIFVFSSWIHISGVMLPVMFLFTEYWWMPVIALAVAMPIAWPRFKSRYDRRKADFSENNELQKLKPQKIILVIKSIGFYFWHTIIPRRPRMYHEFLYYFSRYESEIKRGYSLNFEFWKGLATLAFLGYEIIYQHNIWAVWFLVFQLTYCNILTVTMNAADRYVCISSVGAMMILVKYMNMIPDPTHRIIAYTVLITFYFMKYQPLFTAYRNKEHFYLYHLNIQRDGVDARENLADHYLARKRYYSAFHVIQEGLILRPGEFKLTVKMAEILVKLGRAKESIDVMEIAAKNAPIGEQKDVDEALADMKAQYAEIIGKGQVLGRPKEPLNRKERRMAGKKK